MVKGQDIIDAIKRFGLEDREVDVDYQDEILIFPLSSRELEETDEYGEPIMEYTDMILCYQKQDSGLTIRTNIWRG